SRSRTTTMRERSPPKCWAISDTACWSPAMPGRPSICWSGSRRSTCCSPTSDYRTASTGGSSPTKRIEDAPISRCFSPRPTRATPAGEPGEWLRMLCQRLFECGLPLHRVALFIRPLHPNVVARAYYWRQDSSEVEEYEEGYDFLATDEHLASPIRIVLATRQEIRRRLADPGTPLDFPVLHELRKDDVTDYLLTPLEFMNGEVHAMSL